MYLLQNIGMGSDTNLFYYSLVTHESFLREGGQEVRLTTHFCLVLWLKVSGALPLRHSYDFMVRTGTP